MNREVSKRTQALLDATEKAESEAMVGAPSGKDRERQGVPGLAAHFKRADKASLERLAELEERFDGGNALPCIDVDPGLVSTGRFFNRLVEAFEAENDSDFAALAEDIRAQGGNLVAALVRSTPDAALPYELVYGERRLRACAKAGVPLKTLVGVFTDEQVALLQARENQFRKAASAVETALQLSSWAKILDQDTGSEVSRETATRVGEMMGYTGRHIYRLIAVAEVPHDLLAIVPGIRRMSLRQVMELAAKWNKDPKGLRDRLKSIPEKALPKEVIDHLCGTTGRGNSKSFSRGRFKWPSDETQAKKLQDRLKELEKEFGVRFGLEQGRRT